MLYKSLRSGAFMRAALFIAASACIAKGDTITTSLFTPLAPSGTPVLIDLAGIHPLPSQTGITGTGYSIAFNPSVEANEGVVQGSVLDVHGTPIGGVTGSTPEYLTGGFGSSLTSNIALSGNYLSTGLGTITITFDTPQKDLALLWGSIDKTNSLKLNDGFSVTGANIQADTLGFTKNGSLAPGGSAYVVIDSSSSFTVATFTSDVVSFEFAGIAASETPFNGVPEPSGMLLLGTGLLLLCGGLRLRRS